MASAAARKRARTGGGDEDAEPVPVTDGFEAPIFGARVVRHVSKGPRVRGPPPALRPTTQLDHYSSRA